jgi:predicted ATP-grasp superfamily ATP-dependent carboligase
LNAGPNELPREVRLSALHERLPVVVLAGGVTALGVLRAYGRAGIPVFVHPDTDDAIRYSRWYRPLPNGAGGVAGAAPSESPSLAPLVAALARSGLQHGFLCACTDDWNRAVAQYAESAAPRFLSVVPTPAVLDRLQDKSQLATVLQELDVPMPATRLIRDSSDLADLPQSSETFYFLKPTDSQRFLAHFGTKGIRVPTAEKARGWLEQIVGAGMSVVLQEYIPGSFTEHYFVDGYMDRRGRTKGLFARRRLRIYPPDFGNSTAMVSVPLEDVRQAVDSVQRVLQAVGYRGIFSAEFKRDARDARFKLLEINTRPWWFIDFVVRCGVDVCRMAYDDAQGREVAPAMRYKIGATCIYPYYDFVAAQPLIQSGHLSRWRWMAELLPALQPVGCWDDPMPATVGFARVMRSAVRNRLRSLVNSRPSRSKRH